jgi:sugar phosphate isomerase/epimerase
MIKIGIRGHDVAKTSPRNLAERVRKLGFDGVQLVFAKALDRPVDFSDLSDLRKAFRDCPIFMLGAYFNPVHPDSLIRENGILSFEEHLRIANRLGARLVGTETGSLMGSPWGYLPENHDPQAFEKAVEVFSRLCDTAERTDSCVALEGAWAHVVYSPAKVREILDRIGSPRLKVTVDLFNFLHAGNHERRMEIFEECLRLFPQEIVIFHLKDYVLANEGLTQVGLGKGLMDFPAILGRIRRVTPEACLIFEGVVGDDISESLALIRNLLNKE